MFHDVWDWAGKFRTTQTCPGIKPYQIYGALTHLCNDVLYWCKGGSDLTIIEQAAKIHHQLVYIHPYPNGNGRFSRLVSDRYLKASKCPFPNWPVDLNKDGQSRKQYIAALKSADIGDYQPFMGLCPLNTPTKGSMTLWKPLSLIAQVMSVRLGIPKFLSFRC
jgi:fido (protein-threonine AMPylation protein)